MNPIDKIFRNSLEHHTSEVPANAWDSISARLDDHKKPFPNILPYISAIGSMMLVIGVVYYTYFIDAPSPKHLKAHVVQIADAQVNNSQISNSTSVHQSIANISTDNHNDVGSMTSEVRESFIPTTSPSKSNNTDIVASASPIAHNNRLPDINTIENFANVEEEMLTPRLVIDIAQLDNNLSNSKLKIYREIKFGQSDLFFKEVKACPFSMAANDKSVDAYVSHEYANRSLSSITGDNQSYIDMRNQTEHSLYSFSAGVRFGYNVGYRWNIHTGVNYSQINEKFDYIDPESNQTRLITIKDYIYQNGSIVDSTVTEELVTVPGTSKLKVYNRYRSLDIPVLARFTILANRNFSLSSMAGVFINMAASQKGMFLDNDGMNPVDFTSNVENNFEAFKTQLGVSLYANISLAYHILPNVDLLLEPNIRVQTESMTAGDYPVNQKYNTIGLSTGVRFKF